MNYSLQNFGATLKALRERFRLSQRELANITGVSFRQIQRIENETSDVTLGKLFALLKPFQVSLQLQAPSPDWAYLSLYGIAVTIEAPGSATLERKRFWTEINRAVVYVLSDTSLDERYKDALKAMLLCLKGHYPNEFNKLENRLQNTLHLSKAFKLEEIRGRDIKLRNITLSKFAKAYAAP